MKIFIDIETLPTDSDEAIDFTVAKIKAPANYKKPEAIQNFINGAKDETVAKTALSGLFGRVYMVGYAIGDGEVDVIYEDSELAVLIALDKVLQDNNLRNEFGDAKATFVGHNAKDFDIPFLCQRMMVNGIKPLFSHYSKPKVDDTMQMFACGKFKQYYSLEALCLAFGLPCHKGDLDGSKVAAYHADGRHTEVIKYCKDDVEDMRRLYRAMTELRLAA